MQFLTPFRTPFRAIPRGLPALLLAALPLWAPTAAHACACGCGVFDVGTGAMFPDGAGGVVSIEADFLNQNTNWSGTSAAPADNNGDKHIQTQFYTAGLQYMFNRRWGIQVDVPYWSRKFTTEDDSGNIGTFNHSAIGDIRIRGVYTGFSPDMSSGLTFGLKLPTGDSNYANFDPDTEIGSGSTDLLLGGFHRGRLTKDGKVGYFLRGQWEQPVQSKSNYRPGNEVIGVAGTYFEGLRSSDAFSLTPLVQVTAAYRGHDGGTDGHPGDSGYTRLIVGPGVEAHFSKVRVYAEAGFAVYNNVSGNQLISKQLYKVTAYYSF